MSYMHVCWKYIKTYRCSFWTASKVVVHLAAKHYAVQLDLANATKLEVEYRYEGSCKQSQLTFEQIAWCAIESTNSFRWHPLFAAICQSFPRVAAVCRAYRRAISARQRAGMIGIWRQGADAIGNVNGSPWQSAERLKGKSCDCLQLSSYPLAILFDCPGC